MALLETSAVSKRFGGVRALDAINFNLESGEIVGLIGPNGAGKTSFFNAITGLVKVDQGEIYFDQRRKRLDELAPHKILKSGVARTFQNLRIFKNMTCLENVAIGFHARTKSNIFDAFFKTPRVRSEEREIFSKSAELLRMMGLLDRANVVAGSLSYGYQKRLEIARALACSPKLLLLDEPVAGMNPTEKEAMAALLNKIQKQQITILVIEHDMKFVMPLCQRIFVMDEGAKIAEGTPAQIQNNQRVIEAYLGES